MAQRAAEEAQAAAAAMAMVRQQCWRKAGTMNSFFLDLKFYS